MKYCKQKSDPHGLCGSLFCVYREIVNGYTY